MKKKKVYRVREMWEGRNSYPGLVIFEKSEVKCQDCKWNSQWDLECSRFALKPWLFIQDICLVHVDNYLGETTIRYKLKSIQKL